MLKQIYSHSENDTMSVARQLAMNILQNKQYPITILLSGDIGAGKTVFVRGFATALGINERDIGSASFVIVAEYIHCDPIFRHIDLYRLTSQQCDDIGIWEYLNSDGINAVEWYENLSDEPENAIRVRIEHKSESDRLITIDYG